MTKIILQKKYLHTAVKKGFTLIELMIVIGIIGILAVIAIPQYTSYVARAQATEAINILGGIKATVAEFKSTKGVFPTDAELKQIYPVASGTDSATKYLQTLAVTSGEGAATGTFTVTAKFKSSGVSNLLSNKTIALNTTGEATNWTCVPGTGVSSDVLPSSCR